MEIIRYDLDYSSSELAEEDYSTAETDAIKAKVDHYTRARDAVKLNNGDYIDLKAYEPAVRHLITIYIRA